MFFNSPGAPTSAKKAIYLLASIILGLLLSFLVHAFIEIKYLNWMEEQGRAVSFYGGCALAPWLQIALWLIGTLGGYFLGRWWWRMVYIDRVWIKKVK